MQYISISKDLLEEIISHCREEYPFEACGILAGKDRTVQKVYKMKNIENSNYSYMMDSKEQLKVMKEIRTQDLEMVAIYHSHPFSDPYPSPKDIRLAYYEDSAYIIISLYHGKTTIKAFEIRNGLPKEIEIKE